MHLFYVLLLFVVSLPVRCKPNRAEILPSTCPSICSMAGTQVACAQMTELTVFPLMGKLFPGPRILFLIYAANSSFKTCTVPSSSSGRADTSITRPYHLIYRGPTLPQIQGGTINNYTGTIGMARAVQGKPEHVLTLHLPPFLRPFSPFYSYLFIGLSPHRVVDP